MQKEQDRLYINKENRVIFDKLKKDGLFKGLSNKDQFLFAMAIGFHNGKAFSPLSTKEGFFFAKDLQPNDRVLLEALALAMNNNYINILEDASAVYKCAEEVANAGIKILENKYNSVALGSYEKSLEKELYDFMTP